MSSRLPIRWRLTAAFAVGMLAVLAAAGAFVYLKVRSDLNEALDESLASRADDVAALVAGGAAPDLDGERTVEGEDSFSEVISPDGSVEASTLSGDQPAITASEAESAAGGSQEILERKVPGIDGSARVLARGVETSDGPAVVVVGATTEDRQEALTGLTGAFAVGAPLAVALASLLGYLLAGRALAPIEGMRLRAARISLERRGERLPLPEADDELRRLGETLNQMLDRIESSLERERVFVADASHELRTPLAILRSELELAERPGRSGEDLRAAVRSATEEVDRLSRLADDLLVIARSDQGRLPISREEVRLDALVERTRARFEPRSVAAGRTIVTDARPSETAMLDPLRIEQALGNLVDNSLRHGAGEVRIGARTERGRVELQVSDEGDGFPEAFQDRAFERFTRADEGRAGGGTGLGLAIVRAIARAHGGEAAIDGASVRLDLPAPP